ncbi:MAG: ureidoglycolate lyase [Geminicoccaceae bacterium]
MRRIAIAPRGTADALGDLARIVATSPGGGDVVNQGFARRHVFGALEHVADAGLRLCMALFETAPRPIPLDVTIMERHARSAQAILSMRGGWIVLVAPDAGNRPAMEGARAVSLGPGEGVIYAPGTWHHPIIAPGAPGLFLVQSWKDDTPADMDEVAVEGWRLDW